MTQRTGITLFEDSRIRVAWDDEDEKYYFSIVDIVQVLTDSVDGRKYWNKLKQRLKAEGFESVTNCHQLKLPAADGKNYKTDVADLEGIFRIIQSIPSKKAEPVKRWLAEVGAQRVDQMIDPELTFQMAVDDYRRQGYSDRWINERMRSIEMRKELTDEWHRSGIHKPKDFAILTNVLTKAWSGMTTGEYKRYKGLTKQNLRDNMTNIKLALNTLAEVATTEYSRQSNPQSMAESERIAQEGGGVARDARRTMERRLGRSVVSPAKASDYLAPTEDTEAKVLPSGKGRKRKKTTNTTKKAILTLAVLCGIGFCAAAQSVDTTASELILIEELGPQFPGGDDSLGRYLLHNLHYPEACHEATGKVYVGFTVETDGTITDVKLLRGICHAYNEEALRIVSTMPRWIPGRSSDGTIVRVRMALPIDFFLDAYRK